MINLLKSKMFLVILGILIVVMVGITSMAGNQVISDMAALVRGEEIVHVADMQGDSGEKDTANDDIEIDGAEQDDEAVNACLLYTSDAADE